MWGTIQKKKIGMHNEDPYTPLNLNAACNLDREVEFEVFKETLGDFRCLTTR